MPYPSPPWQLHGRMWLSLFAVTRGSRARPAGVYGVAFLDNGPGSVLTYQELLVARLVREGRSPRVTVTDSWVDSVPSRDGGRSLWAIPKELADLHLLERRDGPLVQTSCDAALGGSALAAARFMAPAVPTVRTPVTLGVLQEGGGERPVRCAVSGSSRNVLARARWDFGADGPLAWLSGQRSLLSLRVSDLRMTFGG